MSLGLRDARRAERRRRRARVVTFFAILGALVLLGWGRRWAYPALLLFTGVTVLGVWKSIVDPWGWIFEGTNALFYPSAVIFAASLVLWAFRDLDRFVLDPRAAG